MKVIKDTLDTEIDKWEDPGDYPNAVASGPLPSYDYISDVIGEVVIELEDGDDPVASGTYSVAGEYAPGYCKLCRELELARYGQLLHAASHRHAEVVRDAGCTHLPSYVAKLPLEEVNSEIFDYLCEAEPSCVNVLKWHVAREGNKLTFTVLEFEQDGECEPPETEHVPGHFY